MCCGCFISNDSVLYMDLQKGRDVPPVFPSLSTYNVNFFVNVNINNFDFRIAFPVFNISLGDIWSYYPCLSTRNLLALQ